MELPDGVHAQYQVNDIVSWIGLEGFIEAIDPYPYEVLNRFPVRVNFNGRILNFTADGKFVPGTNRCLEIIGKRKERVKKWRWVMRHKTDGTIWVTDEHYSEPEAFGFERSEPLNKVEVTETEEEA